jgi:C4-dicarboxylate-specific signal transduction histidine kinase
MHVESESEAIALRKALRELVALSTIPAAWVGREPPTIARGLADVLIGSLDLDFAFVRLCDPKGSAAIEVTRGNAWKTFPEWLRARLNGGDPFSRKEFVTGLGDGEPYRGVAIPIGINAEGGLVAAACSRYDFPSETDLLLLSVAANHAAAAFQNARLRNELDGKVAELRQARSELETKVAQRTAELRQSEAYLADAQRLTHTGSWAWSVPTREIRHSSEEHSRLYGFDPAQPLPSREEFLQRIHPDDRARLIESFGGAATAGKDFEAHFRIVVPDGTTKYVHGVGHPVFNASGALVEFVGTLVDVTERRRADEERERLRQAQADLAYLSRVTTMGELTASLAHEIRQPIAAAVTDARTCLRWLARDSPAVEDAREAASRVVKDVTRAAEIIASISVLFQKGSVQREPVDVNELIREMIVLLRSQANRYSIAIRTELDPNAPSVMADRVQLQQVFMNLILNGIDAMQDTTSGNELTIRSEADNGHLLISVSDTGVGLPSEHTDQIFRAFFTTKDHGIGMGLPISRSIVESHGGRLWATANSARGATFQFSLPAAVAAHI